MEISKEEYDELQKYKMLWQTTKEEGTDAYVSMKKPWFGKYRTLTSVMLKVEFIYNKVRSAKPEDNMPRTWKKFSIACGISKDKCEYRDANSPSKCSLFDDRNKCAKSRNNAKRNSIKASKKAKFPGVYM